MLSGCNAPSPEHIEYFTTSHGMRYGELAGKSGKPVALVFTTDVASSLDGTFTSVPKKLHEAGYTIISVDVTCHGKDVGQQEAAGLDCWATRIKGGGVDVFAHMVDSASDAISDSLKRHNTHAGVVAIGVSRGGYAAIRTAVRDPRIDSLVLLAPVTDLKKLREFSETAVDQAKYGFVASYSELAKRRIFLQIGNADDRVGTAAALGFGEAISAAGQASQVDVTMIATPIKGHGVAAQDLATRWVLNGSISGSASGAP